MHRFALVNIEPVWRALQGLGVATERAYVRHRPRQPVLSSGQGLHANRGGNQGGRLVML